MVNGVWMEGSLLPRCSTWERRSIEQGPGKGEEAMHAQASSGSKIARCTASCAANSPTVLTRSYQTGEERASNAKAESRRCLV
jgi:hypothetical protein